MNRKATKTDTALCVMKTGCRCMYCGEKLSEGNFTVDHIDAWCKSKNSALINIAPCCDDCNNLKGSSSLEEFRSKLSKSILEKARADKKTASLLRLGVLKVDKNIKFYFEKIKPEMLDYIESLFDDPESFGKNLKVDSKKNNTEKEAIEDDTSSKIVDKASTLKMLKKYLDSNTVTSGCLVLKKDASSYVVYQKTKVGLLKEVGRLDDKCSCILKVPVKGVLGVSAISSIDTPCNNTSYEVYVLESLLSRVWYALNGKYCENAIIESCAPFNVNNWSISGQDKSICVYDNNTSQHYFITCLSVEGEDYKWCFGTTVLNDASGKSTVQLLKYINGSHYLHEVLKNE